MVNQKYLDKAEVLIEALPYIQRFNRKIVVIKYGGSAMLDEKLKANVIKDAVLLKLVGFKPIIVHGGGKEISKWVGKVGMEAKFINGLRVTDSQTMEIAEMVLAKVNKELVSHVESLGVQAVGTPYVGSAVWISTADARHQARHSPFPSTRSEERRVGKECRSR